MKLKEKKNKRNREEMRYVTKMLNKTSLGSHTHIHSHLLNIRNLEYISALSRQV